MVLSQDMPIALAMSTARTSSDVYEKSNFQMCVENNPGLVLFCFTLLCDWSRAFWQFGCFDFQSLLVLQRISLSSDWLL